MIGEEFIFPPNISMSTARIMARAAGIRIGATFKVLRVGNRLHCRRIETERLIKLKLRHWYPWRTMKVGDVFEFRNDNLLTCRSYASKMGAELGRKFKVEEGKQAIRCRRIR